MKTFLITFTIFYGLLLIVYLYKMFTIKPSFNNGRGRFGKNWNEGGQYALLFITVGSIVFAIGIAKLILCANFLEANS